MTNRERCIVSAYTGYLLCNYSEYKKYIEEKLGHPVLMNDLKLIDVQDEIRKAVKPDFLALRNK